MLLSENNRSFKVTVKVGNKCPSLLAQPSLLRNVSINFNGNFSLSFDQFIFFANAQDKTWSHL